MHSHLRIWIFIFLLLISFNLVRAQDYKVFDLTHFNFKGNVKHVDIMFYDSNDSLLFDNNMSNFNLLSFNEEGYLITSVKMNSLKDTVEWYFYTYNSKNQLIKQLKHRPLQKHLTKYGGIDEIRKFYYTQEGQIDYQLELERNRETVKDSISYSFDSKNNLIRQYQHNKGRYNIFLNQYNKKNQRINSIYYSSNPRDPIWVWKYEYDDNKQTEYRFIYDEKDLKGISIRVISELVVKLDKRNANKSDLEEYLDYVLLRKYLNDVMIPNLNHQFKEGGDDKWSSKFDAEPEVIKYFTEGKRESKIIFPTQTVEFMYNKQQDLVRKKIIYEDKIDIIETEFLYNSFGDWIEKTEYKNSEKIMTVKREISYY